VVDDLGRVTAVVDELEDLLAHPLKTAPVNSAVETMKAVLPKLRRMICPPFAGRLPLSLSAKGIRRKCPKSQVVEATLLRHLSLNAGYAALSGQRREMTPGANAD
jgi:hypothetical protein